MDQKRLNKAYASFKQCLKRKKKEATRKAADSKKIHFLDYRAYINSKAWRNGPRRDAMKRPGGICEICESRKATRVHHKTYERLGCEKPTDLQALCKWCHEKIHGIDLDRQMIEAMERSP